MFQKKKTTKQKKVGNSWIMVKGEKIACVFDTGFGWPIYNLEKRNKAQLAASTSLLPLRLKLNVMWKF